jgi:sugar phosphate isomerase/epimerase
MTGPAAGGTRTPLPPTVSLGVSSYHEPLVTGSMSSLDFLEAAARLGFRSVELCDKNADLEAPARTLGALAARGLCCPSFAARNDFTIEAGLQREIDHVRRCFDVASTLGARVVRIWTGTARADTRAMLQVRRAFERLVPHAESLGLMIAVETHGGLSNDVGFMNALISDIASSAIGVCLDFGNLDATDRYEAVEKLVPITVHVHVKSYEFDDAGRETTFDLGRCIEGVARWGFDGLWVIEYEGLPPYEPGILATVSALQAVLDEAVG